MPPKNDKPIIPDLSKARKSVLKTTDELEYGLRAVVRILGRRKGAAGGYFFDGFRVKFADELEGRPEIQHEETFLDYENLKIVIFLPTPSCDKEAREVIRHQYTMDYTLGADDLKTRAALVAFQGLDENTKTEAITQQKELESAEETTDEEERDSMSMRILYCEDEPDLAELGKEYLKTAFKNCEIRHFENGKRAFEHLEDYAVYDLVVSDNNMPGKKGEEIFSRLRERGIYIPFLLCSASPAASNILSGDLSAYLSKPFSEDEFIKTIHDLLEKFEELINDDVKVLS